MDEFATMCREIIKCGAIIDRNDVVYNDKVLCPCESVWRSNEEQLVELFLRAGASIDISGLGWTPLHHAAFEFQTEDCTDGAIQALRGAGVDINAIDKEGRTMLDIAARPTMRSRGSKATIQQLQALGAKAAEGHEVISEILRS
jgi:hypothetical protein